MTTPTTTVLRALVLVCSILLIAVTFPRMALAATGSGTTTDCTDMAKSATKYKDELSLACKVNKRYGHIIEPIAHLHEYDKNLITAMIVVESNGNVNATSHVGAKGLMQLMPSTAKTLGAKDIRDPMENILAGTKYMRSLEEDYGFLSVEEALLAYNMGPRKAAEWLDEEGHSATDASYVKKVMAVYQQLEAHDQEVKAAQTKSSTEELLKNLLLRITGGKRVSDQPELLTSRRIEIETKED